MNYSKTTLGVLIIALLQGIGLLGLDQSINEDVWSYFSPQTLLASYAVIVFIPTMLMLAWDVSNKYKLAKYMSVYTLLLLLMTFYTGTQLTTETITRSTATWLPLILTLVVMSFITLPFIQKSSSEPDALVKHPLQYAWVNVSTMILALGFVIGVFAVLLLWAALFSALNIEFFADLFSDEAFIYPVAAIAQGVGILLVKRLSSVVININLLVEVLTRFLLVIVCSAFLLFLLTIPFSGLEPLWASGGSLVVLILQLVLLVFLGAAKPYAQAASKTEIGIHMLITTTFCLLPLLTAISLYGLSLRIEQYGWTVVRFWAVTLWALLAVFSLGYAIKIAQKQLFWLDHLQPFKVKGAWLVLVLGGLIHSPLLDFRSMTLEAQLQDLKQGKTDIETFDFQYLNDELGKPGQAALLRLEQDLATTDPEIAPKIRAVINQQSPISTKRHFIDSLTVLGTDNFSETDMDALFQWALDGPWQVRAAERYWVLPKDMDGDKVQEWLVVAAKYDSVSFWLLYQQQGQLQHQQMHMVDTRVSEGETPSYSADRMSDMVEAINAGQVTLERPRWFQLKIGETKLAVDEGK